MKLTVSFDIEHKNLDKLQKIMQYTHAFAHIPKGLDGVAVKGVDGVVVTTEALAAPPAVVAPPADKPVVDKPPTANPDEVRAAMLAYSKVKGTQEAVAVLKDVGKADQIKKVDASLYPALLKAFAV